MQPLSSLVFAREHRSQIGAHPGVVMKRGSNLVGHTIARECKLGSRFDEITTRFIRLLGAKFHRENQWHSLSIRSSDLTVPRPHGENAADFSRLEYVRKQNYRILSPQLPPLEAFQPSTQPHF